MEANVENMVEELANVYDKKFSRHLDLLRESKIFKAMGREMNVWDAYAMGTVLEQYCQYEQYMKEANSLSALGQLPNVALDVLTTSMGLSVATAISSLQPIDDELGKVYFRNIFYTKTRQDATAGEQLLDPRQRLDPHKHISGYARDFVEDEILLASTTDGTTSYTLALSYAPVRTNLVVIKVPALNLEATDDGTGTLAGNGIHGTVNYTTGTVVLDFSSNPGDGKTITASYSQDFEESSTLPEIHGKLAQMQVNAHIYTLVEQTGILANYAFNKRFGKALDNSAALDLAGGLAMVASLECIDQYRKAWARNLLDGATPITFTEVNPNEGHMFDLHYRQGFEVKFDQAEAEMNYRAGRGTVNRVIAGRDMATMISHQNGFQKIEFAKTFGPHIIGRWKNCTIVRDNSLLDPKEAFVGYIDDSMPWDAAVTRSPFMPLFISDDIVDAGKPFKIKKVAAEWCAYTAIVPKYVGRLVLV